MNIKGNRLCAAYVNDGGEAGIRRVYDDATRAQTEGLFDVIPGVFTAEDIRAGDPFTERNVRSVRPGGGCEPRHLEEIVGRCAACDLRKGTPMKMEYVK